MYAATCEVLDNIWCCVKQHRMRSFCNLSVLAIQNYQHQYSLFRPDNSSILLYTPSRSHVEDIMTHHIISLTLTHPLPPSLSPSLPPSFLSPSLSPSLPLHLSINTSRYFSTSTSCQSKTHSDRMLSGTWHAHPEERKV